MKIKGIKFTEGNTSVTFENPEKINKYFDSENKYKMVRIEKSIISLIYSFEIAPFEIEENIGKNTLELILKNWDFIKQN